MYRITLGLLLAQAAMGAQGTASGTLTVGGQAIAMRYAQAVQVPDFFDKSKMATRLVVSNVPVPLETMQDTFAMMRLSDDDKVHALAFEIGASRNTVNMSIYSSKFEGSISGSEGLQPGAIPVFTATRMEGALSGASRRSGDYKYDVKFATDIAARVVAAPPSSADVSAAGKAGSTQAYLAFLTAMRSGNKAKIIEMSTPRVREMMKQPDFAEKLSFIQEMMPQNVQVLKAVETGDTATLTVTGNEGGKTRNGTVTLQRMAGKWLIDRESWRSGN